MRNGEYRFGLRINPAVGLGYALGQLSIAGFSLGVGAVLFTMKVEPGSTVAVFGLGGIGLATGSTITLTGLDAVNFASAQVMSGQHFGYRLRLNRGHGLVTHLGNGTRQRTFSFVLQCSGSFFSWQIPLPFGPRQPGQFSATAANVETATNKLAAACRISVGRFAVNRVARGISDSELINRVAPP